MSQFESGLICHRCRKADRLGVRRDVLSDQQCNCPPPTITIPRGTMVAPNGDEYPFTDLKLWKADQ
ncbi:MAG: hypothetical protein E5W06_00315 [Mesorhizobium sp.]|nr:MAG: hypothetical protein E5W06_00315 [Mesorhizobium sp.]